MADEEWVTIDFGGGNYQVSNKSRVRSLDQIITDTLGRKYPIKGRILNPIYPKNMYPYIVIRNGDKRYNKTIHRLVAEAFIPNPENKPQVNHINGIKTDNRIENLEWVTASENGKHAFKTGLSSTKKGEDSIGSILTESKVLAIKRLYRMNKKFHRTNTAKKLGVNINTITSIIKNRNWNHITLNN